MFLLTLDVMYTVDFGAMYPTEDLPNLSLSFSSVDKEKNCLSALYALSITLRGML